MENEALSKNFIEQIIDKDIESGHCKKVITRFPPEPNGYLHIGHAKSILLNYGLAKEYGGQFNMRFDDTNPTKEKVEFVDSIKADVEWLGAEWNGDVLFASDYFPQMYEAAVKLIKKGKAYVDDLSAEEIRKYRGTLTEPGKESPYRNRSVEENLQLFEEMKEGKYADGTKVLRAKIDMASPNINMRDPVIYRVGDKLYIPDKEFDILVSRMNITDNDCHLRKALYKKGLLYSNENLKTKVRLFGKKHNGDIRLTFLSDTILSEQAKKTTVGGNQNYTPCIFNEEQVFLGYDKNGNKVGLKYGNHISTGLTIVGKNTS